MTVLDLKSGWLATWGLLMDFCEYCDDGLHRSRELFDLLNNNWLLTKSCTMGTGKICWAVNIFYMEFPESDINIQWQVEYLKCTVLCYKDLGANNNYWYICRMELFCNCKLRILFSNNCWVSSVSMETRLWATHPGNLGVIPSRDSFSPCTQIRSVGSSHI